MKLDPNHLDSLEALACEAAKDAGEYIAKRVDDDWEIQRKEGAATLASGVVTEVDFESQKRILRRLSPSLPEYDLGLLTEESEDDSSRHEKDFFWCIDPLDGTLPFTEGRAGYSVAIALVSRAGEAVLGIVYDPVEKCLYRARKGFGVTRNGCEWKGVSGDADEITLVTDRSFSVTDRVRQALEEEAQRRGLAGVRILNQGGGAMNAIWTVENAPAVYPKFPKATLGGGALWDFAATSCLYQELGLVCTDMFGEKLHLNPDGTTFMNRGGTLYTTDSELAEIFYQLVDTD